MSHQDRYLAKPVRSPGVGIPRWQTQGVGNLLRSTGSGPSMHTRIPGTVVARTCSDRRQPLRLENRRDSDSDADGHSSRVATVTDSGSEKFTPVQCEARNNKPDSKTNCHGPELVFASTTSFRVYYYYLQLLLLALRDHHLVKHTSASLRAPTRPATCIRRIPSVPALLVRRRLVRTNCGSFHRAQRLSNLNLPRLLAAFRSLEPQNLLGEDCRR